jgi:hypothetical protein
VPIQLLFANNMNGSYLGLYLNGRSYGTTDQNPLAQAPQEGEGIVAPETSG